MDAMWKPIEKFKSIIIGEAPKFGQEDPRIESKCEQIHVFMVCFGQATVEHRRVVLPPNTTIRAAKGLFGRDMAQNLVRDENGFRFNESALEKPISNFSNHCNLLIQFTCEDHLKELQSKLIPK